MPLCTNCGTPQIPSSRYCHECGNPVSGLPKEHVEEFETETPLVHAYAVVEPTAPTMMEAFVASNGNVPLMMEANVAEPVHRRAGLRTKIVELSSHNFKPARYDSTDGMIYSAKILNLHSKSQPKLFEHTKPGDCGDKWGFNGYILYVKDGIRATFEITLVDKDEFRGYEGGKAGAVLSDFSMSGNGSSKIMQSFPFDDIFNVTSSISVTCWVKTKAYGYHYLVSRGEWTEGYSIGILDKGDRGGSVRGCLGGIRAQWANFVGTTTIKPGKFYHVGMTYSSSSGEGRIYVNGRCEKRMDLGQGNVIGYNGKTGLFIGGEALGLGNAYKGQAPRHFLNGEIAGFEITGRKKEDAEVVQEFVSGCP
ncbi:hypothetical protein TrVE_jg2961 [Triparma verrucosa]|uniref:Uncharacterized protein n=1 Tax=Triparma verrucosa TaxID=1606542 RepID=A0A9W7FKY2_9STRA|nr:hypothetical protein TrVE_jg2961 [Triparma verrucosa]